MSVEWSSAALADLDAFIARAWEYAYHFRDPQIVPAALRRNDEIWDEGERLDGIATYQRGPAPNSHLYITCNGLFVLLYWRDGDAVLIQRVLPSRSNWRATLSENSDNS